MNPIKTYYANGQLEIKEWQVDGKAQFNFSVDIGHICCYNKNS